MDDVIEINKEVSLILNWAKKNGIFVSLEIVPYLSKIIEYQLNEFDPGEQRLIVSQHGYTHVLNVNNAQHIRSEFDFSVSRHKDVEVAFLKGHNLMKSSFPRRFKGGFSAPFDRFPLWMVEIWKNYKCKYITTINKPQHMPDFPCIEAVVDVWDWSLKQFKNSDDIVSLIENSIQQHGYGIVVHPIHLKRLENRNKLVDLLQMMVKANFESFNFNSFLI